MSEEQDLIRRCVRGDEDAFAELVDRCQVMVFNIADRMVRDHSATEDLAQEVFVRVYRGLPAFRGDAKLSTWIYQIAYRVCLEELERPHRRQRHVSLDRDSIDLQVADEGFAGVDLCQALDHYLARLPPHYRMALTLYYLQGREYAEIAEVMELPIGTVKTYLHRAKEYLRKRLLEEGVQDEAL